MRVASSLCLSLVLSLSLSSNAPAQEAPAGPPAPADWGQALREDAQALHDIVRDNHPGPQDILNLGFNRRLEDGLALALRRSETATTEAEWNFAVTEYAASFNDVHLGLSEVKSYGQTPGLEWPGFMTRLVDGRHRVQFSTGAGAPPLNAALVSCDGRDADAVAEDVFGRTTINWTLASTRTAVSVDLFVNDHNPYSIQRRACVFDVDGEARSYDLNWRPFGGDERREAYRAAGAGRFRTPIELRTWSGGAWIGINTFGGGSARQAEALQTLTDRVATQAADLRSAPILVFDLRGNDGGSSSWLNTMATSIWGEARFAAAAPHSVAVDWRASPENLAAIRSFKSLPVMNNPGVRELVERIETGMADAVARKRPFWTEVDAPAAPSAPTITEGPPVTGRVFVITDDWCASACLDAVDLLKALGAVQIGRQTSADTLYLEIRYAEIPSGRFKVAVPMKVYRGRPRGNGEPQTPAHAWPGSMSDTAGLENWIAELARMD